MEERIIKYIGNGRSIAGVPARDLTAAEYEQHKEAIEACATTIYEAPKTEKKPTKKEAKE